MSRGGGGWREGERRHAGDGGWGSWVRGSCFCTARVVVVRGRETEDESPVRTLEKSFSVDQSCSFWNFASGTLGMFSTKMTLDRSWEGKGKGGMFGAGWHSA